MRRRGQRFNFAISYTFLSLIGAITIAGTFWLYAGFALCAIVFFWTLVPETKGRTLEEIEGDVGVSDVEEAAARA